jgi:limonene-1,2-epoxide hydrolase
LRAAAIATIVTTTLDHQEEAMSQGQTTTIGTVRAAVDDFITAWNAHDPDAVRRVFTTDGTLYDPFTPDGITGPAIAESVRHALEQFRDIAFVLGSVVEADGGRVAFEWRMTATAASAEGRPVPLSLVGCDVASVRDGRFAELRSYFDRARIMEQLSARPAA